MSFTMATGIICLVCGIMFSIGYYQEHRNGKKDKSQH